MNINRKLEPMSEELCIYTLVGNVLIVSSVYSCCTVKKEGVVKIVDLIPLNLQEFDIILRTNFLFKYYASMDCHRKEVILRMPREVEVVFRVTRRSYLLV